MMNEVKTGEIKPQWLDRYFVRATQSSCVICGASLLSTLRGLPPVCPDSGAALPCSRRPFAGSRESRGDPGGFLFGSPLREYPFGARPCPFSVRPHPFATARDLLGRLCELRERLLCPFEFPFYRHSSAGHIRRGDGHPTTRACGRKRDAGDNDNAAAPRVSRPCP